MSTTTAKVYRWLKIKGPLSVVPITPEDVKVERLSVFLLMGPTGSGKSAFIESLSPDQKLDISKDSLESVTQEVVCYRVFNLTRVSWNVILLDTPGFLDIKLSESRITKMITATLDSLRRSATDVVVRIFYFQPITDTRIGRSKMDAVMLLRAFARSFGATRIAVVTTMWNHVSYPKQIDSANHRLNCLRNEIFVLSHELGIDIIKFEFSFDSALSILDSDTGGWFHDIRRKSQTTDSQYQSLICNNLLKRITNAQQQLHMLAEDKRNATTPGKQDRLLLKVIRRDQKMASNALKSFAYDLSILDPMAYESVFPGGPFSPHPSTPKTHSRRLARFYRVVPFKKLFERRK